MTRAISDDDWVQRGYVAPVSFADHWEEPSHEDRAVQVGFITPFVHPIDDRPADPLDAWVRAGFVPVGDTAIAAAAGRKPPADRPAGTGRAVSVDGTAAGPYLPEFDAPEPPPCDTKLLQLTTIREVDSPCYPGAGSCFGAPCVDPQDCTLTDDDLDDADREVGFGEVLGAGPFTPDEKAFVIHALAHLQQHLDLVQFACCAVMGPGSETCECLIELVADGGKSIDLRKGTKHQCEERPDGIFPAAYAHVGTNNVYICDCFFDGYLDRFLFDDTRCVSLNLAVILAHELMHCCGWEADDPDEQGCSKVVQFQTLLQAGLEGRCPVPTDCLFPSVGPSC